jgi:hypothetical protein
MASAARENGWFSRQTEAVVRAAPVPTLPARMPPGQATRAPSSTVHAPSRTGAMTETPAAHRAEPRPEPAAHCRVNAATVRRA